jgi:hypothetical protein
MPWTGAWIAIALIVGFYLGVTLMALLGMARASENKDADRGRLAVDATGVPIALRTSALPVLSTAARKWH